MKHLGITALKDPQKCIEPTFNRNTDYRRKKAGDFSERLPVVLLVVVAGGAVVLAGVGTVGICVAGQGTNTKQEVKRKAREGYAHKLHHSP